jgi:minor tail protein Z (GPZ)
VPAFDVSSPFLREAKRLQALQKGSKSAISRASSTLARRLPVEARRDIQTEYNVKAATVNQYLSVTKDDTSVTLIGRARATGLIEFGGKWGGPRSAGAVASALVSEGAHTYGGTFIAVGRSGNRQIFDRALVGGRRAPRLPLKTLYGPSVASMLRKGEREDRLADFAQSVLSTEIDRLIKASL